MSILAFKDDARLLPVRVTQKFTRLNSVAPYQVYLLTTMTGAELLHLYRYNGVSNVQLALGTDYTLVGNTVTLLTPLGASEVLIAVPKDRLNLNFGGVFGAVKTSTTSVVLAREPEFMYNSLLLFSIDLDETFSADTYMDAAFDFEANQSMLNADSEVVYGSKCTSTALTGLTINALQGRALVLNNVYIGLILANTVSAVLVDNVSFVRAGQVTDDLQIFPVGTVLFALNVDDSVPANDAFALVISIPDLEEGLDSTKVWVRNTLPIPETPTNYPNMGLKLTGIEYRA